TAGSPVCVARGPAAQRVPARGWHGTAGPAADAGRYGGPYRAGSGTAERRPAGDDRGHGRPAAVVSGSARHARVAAVRLPGTGEGGERPGAPGRDRRAGPPAEPNRSQTTQEADVARYPRRIAPGTAAKTCALTPAAGAGSAAPAAGTPAGTAAATLRGPWIRTPAEPPAGPAVET